MSNFDQIKQLTQLKKNVISSRNKEDALSYLEDYLVSIVVRLADIVEKQGNEIVELRKQAKSLETKLKALEDIN